MPEKRHRTWYLIKSDLWRHYGRANLRLFVRAFLWNRTFAPVATLRLINTVKAWPKATRFIFLPPVKLLHRWSTERAGIDLPAGIIAGPGLRITHGWGLVISRGTVLGSNVTLMHGVTIGAKDRVTPEVGDERPQPSSGDRRAYPKVGDNVFIGAKAIILGGVDIGTGAVIGPGSVVTKDVSPGCSVVGNPQRVIGQAKRTYGSFPAPIRD